MGPKNRLVKNSNSIFFSIFAYFYPGFHPKDVIFSSCYKNFRGNALDIVMWETNLIFAKIWSYPDKSKIRSGADFIAAQYLSDALNFKYR